MALTFWAGNDRKTIGKEISQLPVATMTISSIIANQIFMTAIFVIAFAPASLTLSDYPTHLDKQRQIAGEIFDRHAFNCFALREKLVTVDWKSARHQLPASGA